MFVETKTEIMRKMRSYKGVTVYRGTGLFACTINGASVSASELDYLRVAINDSFKS